MRRFTTLLFAGGLAFFLWMLMQQIPFGEPPMAVGSAILGEAPHRLATANIVTSVVLGYRGIDTLGELAILFTASLVVGLVLGRSTKSEKREASGGFILLAGSDLLFPLLLIVGFYIILHGHLTPGGGFQGGVILAAAFFIPLLARPNHRLNHLGIALIEGLAGAAFILIGLVALWQGGSFLQPLFQIGVVGELISAGTLPLLYLAVGLKVGAELAGLLATLAETGTAAGVDDDR